MGSSQSQPLGTPAPNFSDIATVPLDQAQQLANQAAKQASATIQQVSSGRSMWQWITLIVGGLAIFFIFLALYDQFAPCSWPNILFTKKGCEATPLGLAAESTNRLSHIQKKDRSIIEADIKKLKEDEKKYGAKAAPAQPVLKKVWNHYVHGGSTGDLLSGSHNAETALIIKGTEAPLSAEDEGAYGMQWWMFVKDWNYGYGKDKPIIQRSDPTSTTILNPSVSLHPTDNSIKISVSVFPTSSGGTSKSTPAPAGFSGSTDDVYICEVQDIPLQKWFAVSMSVFGRNLDVYIDGKLVKSCFLPGVPKPATGDITINPNGGFSGKMCSFYHFPRMITPGDAITFASAGTNCYNESGTTTTATGSSLKFGMYDALGKQVKEYQF